MSEAVTGAVNLERYDEYVSNEEENIKKLISADKDEKNSFTEMAELQDSKPIDFYPAQKSGNHSFMESDEG